MPLTMVNTAMGENLTVFGEIKLALDEPIGELAWIYCKRTDVSRYLLGVFFHTFTENNFEDP